MIKFLKRSIFKIISVLPPRVQHKVIRSSVQVPNVLDDRFEFKIVESTDELEASFRLVYLEYIKLGYCGENSEKMRATIYHALESTSVIIAKDKKTGEVVGTLTLVRDSALRLPIEQSVNLSSFRFSGARLAEVTSLVIHPDYRRHKGGILLFPMMKLMYEYAKHYFGVSSLIVTVEPRTASFYKALLLFEDVQDGFLSSYLGAPAQVLRLNLETAEDRFKKIYSDKSASKNLYHFFVEQHFPQIIYPERNYYKVSDSVVTSDYFQKVFLNKLKIQLSNDQREHLKNFDPMNFFEVLRKEGRFASDLKAVVEFCDENHLVHVRDISKQGLRISVAKKFAVGENVILKVRISPKQICTLNATVAWCGQDHLVGLQIESKSSEWLSFLAFVESDLSQKVSMDRLKRVV